VLVVTDGDALIITDLGGEILAEHTRSAPGVTCVGNGRPRGPRPRTTEVSPKSGDMKCHRCPDAGHSPMS
jgi:hypothetical protein